MTEATEKGHNAPCSNRDFDFFYSGLEREELLAQQCTGCGAIRTLPSPACGECHSLDWSETRLSGGGTLFSYAVHYHPPLPGFETPHPMIVADLAEGVRMIGAMDGTDPARLTIGMPVAVEFLRRGDVAAFRFRPA